jgi:hypothetical protein
MTESKQKEISDYISRSIPDIARKCGVKSDEVLGVMKQMISHNIE